MLVPSSASTQPFTESDLADLSLEDIDRTINEIASRVSRLKVGIAPAVPSPDSALGSAQTSNITQAAVPTARSRANAFCFQDALTDHKNERELDAFFDQVDAMASRVNTTVVSFDTLKTNYSQGNCPEFMRDMLVSMQGQVASVSRRDLSDLVFHLESCWPDDGMTEINGNPLDIDPVSYTHLRAHETKANLVCRLLLEKKK